MSLVIFILEKPNNFLLLMIGELIFLASLMLCHSREGGNPVLVNLDSRLRGNDKNQNFTKIKTTINFNLMNSAFSKTSKNRAFSLIEISIVILVIGILIMGTMYGVSFLGKYRLSAAQKSTKNSPVDKIEDLSLWLEPTMETSIISVSNANSPEDGDAISAWNDVNTQVISKINLTQNVSSKQPTYVRKGIGGLPSLSFQGDDYLVTNLSSIIAGKNKYTIIAVWQESDISGSQTIFYQGGSRCDGSHAGINTEAGYINGLACGSENSRAFAYEAGKPYAVIYRVDSSQTDNVIFYANGQKYGPVAKIINVGAGNNVVGYGGGDAYFKGLVSEIIVYNHALNDVEIEDIRGYLRGKYGFGA